MVASIVGGSSVADQANSVFSRLDTRNQGYIEKTDLAGALAASGKNEGTSDSSAVDDMFSAIDGDSDGKVTKSELTDAMTKLSDQLNAQFDASRVQGGMPPGPPPGGQAADAAGSEDSGSVDAAGAASGAKAAGGPQGVGGPRGAGGPRGGGAGRAEGTDETDSTDGTTSSTSTDYVAAADTDGDGTVSDAEQAAYDKKVKSGEVDKNGNPMAKASDGAEADKTRRQDPEHELAQALHMLKAYADNSGDSDTSTASTSSVSVEA